MACSCWFVLDLAKLGQLGCRPLQSTPQITTRRRDRHPNPADTPWSAHTRRMRVLGRAARPQQCDNADQARVARALQRQPDDRAKQRQEARRGQPRCSPAAQRQRPWAPDAGANSLGVLEVDTRKRPQVRRLGRPMFRSGQHRCLAQALSAQGRDIATELPMTATIRHGPRQQPATSTRHDAS